MQSPTFLFQGQYRKQAYSQLNAYAMNNKLKELQEVLKTENFNLYGSIHFNDDRFFKTACIKNCNKMIHYLINDYGIQYTHSIKNWITKSKNTGVIELFEKRKLSPNDVQEKIIKELDKMLSVSNLNFGIVYAKIFLNNNLEESVNNGNIEVMDFLLTQDHISKYFPCMTNPDIHANEDAIFKSLCESWTAENKIINDTLIYLIFEKKIEKTNEIKEFLVKNKKENILDFFEKRDLNNGLVEELSVKKDKNIPNKNKV